MSLLSQGQDLNKCWMQDVLVLVFFQGQDLNKCWMQDVSVSLFSQGQDLNKCWIQYVLESGFLSRPGLEQVLSARCLLLFYCQGQDLDKCWVQDMSVLVFFQGEEWLWNPTSVKQPVTKWIILSLLVVAKEIWVDIGPAPCIWLWISSPALSSDLCTELHYWISASERGKWGIVCVDFSGCGVHILMARLIF